MASITHITSRRAMLGGIAAIPVAFALPAMAQKGGSAWAERLAAYRRADADLKRLCRSEPSPLDAGYPAWDRVQIELVDAHEEALIGLLNEPAPNAEAMGQKLAIYGEEFGVDRWLAPVLADVRRMLNKGVI